MADTIVACRQCGSPMRSKDEQDAPDQTAHITLHVCGCGRKAMVIYEPGAGASDEALSWVEQEVKRHKSFFPSDFTGGGGGGEVW